MNRAVLAAVLCLAFIAVTVAVPVPAAYAQACDPKKEKCPPPKADAECSPGYWKNHPETWVGFCCNTDDDPTCSALQSALQAQGPGSGVIREGAAEFLDACFGSAEETPCTDD